MKIRTLIGIAAAAIIISAIAFLNTTGKTSDQNKIRVAFFPNISHAVPIVGMENGEFARELGDIPIETKVVDSGPQAIEALFANSVDIAYVGPAPFVNGYVKSGGTGLTLLAGAANNGASLVIQKDSTISSISDLAGKKIAAPFIGNTQDVSLRHYLSEYDLRPAEKGGSVVIYNIANSETYTLFAKGDIDAAWVPEPTATMLVENLGGKRLLNEEELWPNKQFPSVLLIARSDFAQKHPDWIAKWLRANQNAIDWINKNPDKAESVFIDFYKKQTGKNLSPKIVHGSFSNIVFSSKPDIIAIKTFASRAFELGYLGRDRYDLDNMLYNKTETSVWQN
jgi:NitT/TauT family transport system substrate-binding protein